MMADFVGEHHLDLLRCKLLEQGIAEQDAAGSAQAGQGGIGLARLAAQMQLENAGQRQSRSLGQAL